MNRKKIWNTSRIIFMLLISLNIHIAWSGPLKNGDLTDTTTELISIDDGDYDVSSPLQKDNIESTRMLGNVLPHSNVPVDAMNNNQIIFGNVLPNSNPSIGTRDDNRNHMNQNSQLTDTNPLSALQSMTGNILPNSNPSVHAGNNNQVLFGNFLPNSNPVLSSSNGAQGGQIPSLGNLNPLAGIQNNLSPLSGIQNTLNPPSGIQNTLNPSSGIQNNLNPSGIQNNLYPPSGIPNNLVNDNLNTNPSQDATSNGIIGTSPVLVLGTQQAVLIPMSSVPSFFQNMLNGLLPLGPSVQNGIGLPNLSNKKV